mgnify:CR=1 FL=1
MNLWKPREGSFRFPSSSSIYMRLPYLFIFYVFPWVLFSLRTRSRFRSGPVILVTYSVRLSNTPVDFLILTDSAKALFCLRTKIFDGIRSCDENRNQRYRFREWASSTIKQEKGSLQLFSIDRRRHPFYHFRWIDMLLFG